MESNPEATLNMGTKGKTGEVERGTEIKPTICSICNPNSHCGIDAHVKDGVVVKVEGSKDNPQNAGALCAKGAASCQYIYHRDRIMTPLRRIGERGSGEFEPISWDQAIATITERLLSLKRESGPESVVFYAGYPKWMRPFLKRLAHSFGSPNYASESSTCYTALQVAAKLNYGDEADPALGASKCLLVWSRNPFYSNPVRAGGLRNAKNRGAKIIEVGPLITPLTAYADIHLRIRPGTSGALALGMAHVIIQERLFDRAFVEEWTFGFEAYRAYVREFSPTVTEQITGVPATLVTEAARLYATTKPAAIISGASPTVHHTNGVQNQRAISALIGLTGNFDVPGGNYVFPSNYLYVSNGVDTREEAFEQSRAWTDMAPRVGEEQHPVWCSLVPEAQAMHIPFQIQSQTPYPIKAMLAFGLNYRMWPGSDYMAGSLKMLDFLVDVELFMTDSAKLADVVLPACSSFERSELKFYADQFVIWTQPVIQPLGEARSDADILFDLAKGLAPDDPLLQKGYQACVDWILEPSGLNVKTLETQPRGMRVENVALPPYRKYEKEGFRTPSGKMEFRSKVLEAFGIDPLPKYEEPRLSPFSAPEVADRFPLIFTTGARLPMFIHSRTFRLPWLRELRPDPMADIHPVDARKRGISHGDWVRLSTPRGAIRVKAHVTEIVPPGVVNMYHGYPEADVNLLIDPEYRDPISGFPGFKSLLCQVERLPKGEG